MGLTIPVSPRLHLLGDQTELSSISKYDLVVIKLWVITGARMIWIDVQMLKSNDINHFETSWDRFLNYYWTDCTNVNVIVECLGLLF